MLIYAETITPRLRYVLNFIFRDSFNADFIITDKLEEFKAEEGAKISYAQDKVIDSFHIPSCGLLAEETIREIDTGLHKGGSTPVLFYMAGKLINQDTERIAVIAESSGMNFDLISAIFYMISRYEEYLPFKPDQYGRFEASESLAGKNGFLELPVVDLWIKDFSEKLEKQFPGLEIKSGKFRFLPTCDIDLPYAFLHRGRARTAGARFKAGFQGAADQKLRKEVLSGKKRDPFDTYPEIEAVHSLHKIRPRIFFLTSRYGKYDKSISPRKKAFKTLVRQTMKYADVGVHPSFRASDNPSE